jgi:glutathione S-transferase
MLELFQAEWCPASRRVRQRLTELGLDYINRQVPVEREARTALREVVGTDTIPALRLENGSVVVGEENILVYLDEQFLEPPEAEAHQQKAAKARRRYLEEECHASPRVGSEIRSSPQARSASQRTSPPVIAGTVEE